MIPRYLTELAEIWTEEAKIKRWLLIEAELAKVEEKLGIIPKGVSRGVRDLKIRPERIAEIERETGHDIIAFLSAVKEKIGRRADYIHFGITSYDLVDTGLSLALREAGILIRKELKTLARILREKAKRYQNLPIMGRTHGMFAEPTQLGLKFLSFYEETRRNIERLDQAIEAISYGKISGAVGTYSQLPPKVERLVLRRLKLKPEPVSSQIVPRDRHAQLLSTLALIGAGLERIGLEIRLLSRSEVGELEEPFGKKQRGSSAMPHKRNPILSERITGLARLLRSYLISALENIALWHERDISHSSVERIILPDATILCHYLIRLTIKVVKGLRINEARIGENLKRAYGIFFSQRLMLTLIKKGRDKDWVYRKIQSLSFSALAGKRDLRSVVEEDKEMAGILTKEELDRIFSFTELLKNTKTIYRRVLNPTPE
ncbi:adenylosuccinate lyase [candidate division WOR-3 bacterium]|uniref:Adenylosuccinate lyase n=1 Tax=candidate division WOR-3 bacterium TaxID=2052148 RepID=A0A660SKL5_UNCW3|nr:MAG: adenylosuccinate lyase [candidate division WOR-3 bacterium]